MSFQSTGRLILDCYFGIKLRGVGMDYGFGIGGRACRVVESALEINTLLVCRAQDECARVEYLNAIDGVLRDREQVYSRGVSFEVHSRKESAWSGYGVGAENEAVDTCLERDFSILYHPWTPVGVYEDIADVEVGACAFYFAFVVEVKSLGVEVKGENMQWDGVVCQPIVFCIAGGELGSDRSGLGGCGLVMAGSANECDGDEDSERAMSHREKGRYCS